MDIGALVGGLIGSVVPLVLGIIGIARLIGRLEERIDSLASRMDRLEVRMDRLDQSLMLLTERVAKVEVRVGLDGGDYSASGS